MLESDKEEEEDSAGTGACPLSSEAGTTEYVKGLGSARPGQNLALTVLYVPYSLDSGGQVSCTRESFPA